MSSLRGQLATWLLVPLLLLWGANAWFSYRVAIESANRIHDRSLLGSVLAIAERITVVDGSVIVDLPYSALEMFESNIQSRVYYRVRSLGGLHITGYEDLPGPSRPGKPGVPTFIDAQYRGDPVRIATLVKPLYDDNVEEPVVIQVAETAELRQTFARDIFADAAIREFLMIIAAVVLVWLAVHRSLRPLEFVRRQVLQRARSDLSPIDSSGIPNEVRPLVDAINEQTGHVSRGVIAQQQFVSDAAHQFKTPLTLLRTQADFASRQSGAEELRPALNEFRSHIDQLSHLVDQMLLLSRTEGSARPDLVSLDLAELAQKATFEMLPVALRRAVDLGFDAGEPVAVVGNEFLLREMLENLIDNAVQFTPAGGQVTVRVAAHRDAVKGIDRVQLRVEDTGCGIPMEERERVFDRFYQVPGGDGTGCGLGLSIVREIAGLHGASVSIADGAVGGGTAVTVAFPVSDFASPPSSPDKLPTRRSMGAITAMLALMAWCGDAALAQRSQDDPGSDPQTIAAARREGALVIYSTTDLAAAGPLLKDFRSLYPQILVDYVQLSSSEAYNRFRAEQEAGTRSADVVWSLAMDLQMKLVNDGFAQSHSSTEAAQLPAWAVWRNEAFGTTYEPVVLVYNRRLVKPDEVPRSHREFASLLRSQPRRFEGKVATYNIEKAGVGFLLASQDSKTWPGYWDLVCQLRASSPQLLTETGVMLERIASGESLLGYNLAGAYAIARARTDPAIGYVLPRDFTLVISRIAFIARRASHPNASRVWIDYLLSRRGQRVLAERAQLYAIRMDVAGEGTASALTRALGASIKPVAVGPGLLTYLDAAKRSDFIRRWNSEREACAPSVGP